MRKFTFLRLSKSAAIVAVTLLTMGLVNLTRADIVITQNTDGNDLANAVTAFGGAGLTVTAVSFSGHVGGEGEASSGTYVLTGPLPDTYGLLLPGIVLSSGNVSDYETGPNLDPGRTTDYDVGATPAQQALLFPITGEAFHCDVTQLDITFDVDASTDSVFFNVVFGSEEFPEFVGSAFIDGFGLFLNGVNIAFAGGLPVNINHPDMSAIAGTELDGVLAPGGDPVVQYSGSVTPGSTGNTLTFIVADASDCSLDTTVYIAGLGGTPPPPPTKADLSVMKTASPDPVAAGGTITHTIKVVNNGPDPATDATMTDNASTDTTIESLSAPAGWACLIPPAPTPPGGSASCTKTTDMAVDEEAEFTVTVRVLDTVQDGTVVCNEAVVGSFTPDTDPDNNTSEACVTVQAPMKCPRSHGFWKNNPNAWPVDALTLGGETYSKNELLTILKTPVGTSKKADASLILAYQLIAAKLNIARGSDPAPVSSTITHADGLLGGFAGKLPYSVPPSSSTGKSMTSDAGTLDSYNNGALTPVCTP